MSRKKRDNPPPTRVYAYGAPLGPTDNAKAVEDQIWLAHRYRNDLVAIERARRGAVRAITSEIGDVAALEANIATIVSSLRELRANAKLKNAKNRRRVPVDPEKKAQIAALVGQLKVARKECKDVKKLLRKKDGEASRRISECDSRANAMIKRYRATCGVYWGTYLLVERAVEAAKRGGPDPKFHRWTGDGRIGVQIQKGLPVAEVFGADTRLQIDLTPRIRVTRRHPEGVAVKNSATVKIRIGSHGRGKAPIWATFPIVLHRPLPEDGLIKMAWVQRKRVGTRWRWEFQIVIEARSFVQLPKRGPVCAIDLGWRTRGLDGLRVGLLVDEHNRVEEIAMPRVIAERLDHADSLRSIRDRNFDEIRTKLKTWLDSTPTVPTWLRDSLRYLMQWKAQPKLARVIMQWRDQRFGGDEEMFALLDSPRVDKQNRGGWRQQERHLYQWEASERSKARLRRRDWYRTTARRVADRYATIVIEDFDLRKIARKSNPEEEEGQHGGARRQRVVVAPSEFRNAFVLAASNTGTQIIKVPAAYTTVTCHSCRDECAFDAAANLSHTCEHCGVRWDQDENAARNLLRAHFGASSAVKALTWLLTPTDPEPLDLQSSRGSSPRLGHMTESHPPPAE